MLDVSHVIVILSMDIKLYTLKLLANIRERIAVWKNILVAPRLGATKHPQIRTSQTQFEVPKAVLIRMFSDSTSLSL